MSKLRLVPGAGGSPIEVTGDKVVGRDDSCDIVVLDASISRRHARIEKRGDNWAVVDQASANGTFIDVQRVTEAGLRHGQTLRLGNVLFRVEIEGGEQDLEATMLGVVAPRDATVVSMQPRPVPPPPAPPPPPRPVSPPAHAAPTAAPPPVPENSGKGRLGLIAAGCFGCLALTAVVVVVLFVTGVIGGGAHDLKLEATGAEKTAEGEAVKVRVVLTVSGYGTRPGGGAYELDLLEGCETLGPNGQRIESLSKVEIERRQTTVTSAVGPPQSFETTLTIDPGSPRGSYTLRLLVTDGVTGKSKTHESRFTLP